jgi:large subunit ribosomal protein L31e
MAEAKTVEEKEYIVPLRRKFKETAKYKRVPKAIKALKKFIARHMKIRDRDLRKIKIDKYLNEEMWFRGIKKPPHKIKVKVKTEGENILVELAEISEKIKWKKQKEKKSKELAEKKKEEKKKAEEEAGKVEEAEKGEGKVEEAEEEKEEKEEKKEAVKEAGLKEAEKKAREVKHEVKFEKQPKHQTRKALAK